MNLDTFISCETNIFDVNDSRLETWENRWSSPFDWKGYDQIEMNEEELNNLVEPLNGMSYAGSDLILKPALPEFTLRIFGTEKGQETRVCFRKTVLPPSQSVYGEAEELIEIFTPLIDAYVFINNKGELADEVITIGPHMISRDGKEITGTFSKAVWSSKTNPLLELYTIGSQEALEFERGMKLAYMAIQKALYDRPTLFTKRTEQKNSKPLSNDRKRKKKKRNVVRAVKVINVNKIEMKKFVEEMNTAKRTINCPSWGVIGHWRNYKSGKRTWVQPYRKGKDRHKEGAYAPKEYRFIEGGLE